MVPGVKHARELCWASAAGQGGHGGPSYQAPLCCSPRLWSQTATLQPRASDACCQAEGVGSTLPGWDPECRGTGALPRIQEGVGAAHLDLASCVHRAHRTSQLPQTPGSTRRSRAWPSTRTRGLLFCFHSVFYFIWGTRVYKLTQGPVGSRNHQTLSNTWTEAQVSCTPEGDLACLPSALPQSPSTGALLRG